MNYNKIITREDIDIDKYNQKFVSCDNYLKYGDKTDIPKLAKLFDDPTTFAYIFLKDDHNERLQLYPYQDMIINDKHRFIYFRAANQVGKGVYFNAKAARNLTIDHGHAHTEVIVSKSLPQALDQMRRIKTLINSMQDKIDYKEAVGIADSMSVLTLDMKDDNSKVKYTNTLIVAPCTEGLLGYAVHELNLDEFEYWDIDIKYFFNQIAKPRTYTTNGRICVMSNPNGSDNFGAELENQRDKDGNRIWHVYNFNFLDRPGSSQAEYDQLKLLLPRQQFESTVAGIRSISSTNYFTPDEIERSYDKDLTELKMVGKQPFFFLDVGAKHDQCVLGGAYIEPDVNNNMNHVYIPIIHCYPVGYPLTRVVGVPTPDTDGWHHEKSVKEHLMEWSVDGIVPIFGVDVTGNSGISPLFESVGIYPIDTVFSGPAKSGMYQRFKYFMEKGLLHRIRSQEFEYQASHLEVKKSQRGYLMLHHAQEDDLDDVMDMTAGLIYLADNPIDVMPSLTII